MTEWAWTTADGNVTARNGRLVLRAAGIRNQRTGKHATITVSIDGHDLDGDLFNFERRDDREKLGRKAWAKLDAEEKKEYPLDFLQDALYRFTLRIWPEFTKCADSIEIGSDEEPVAPTFPLYPYIMDGAGTIPFAPPKAGKSYLLYLWGVSIDADCSLMWPVDRRRVLVVNLERSAESVKRRLWYVNEALGVDGSRRLRILNRKGKRLESVYDSVANIIQAEGIEVLLLDSISRAGYGKLVDDEIANSVIDALNSLCPTWVALAHTPRADASHTFGSVMFNAGQDIGVRVNSKRLTTKPTLGLSLEVTDPNDLAPPPMEIVALDFAGFHLAAVRKAEASEFPALVENKPIDLADQCFEFLMDVGKMSAGDVADQLGLSDKQRPNVSKIFNKDPRFRVAGRDGHKVLYEPKTS